MCIGSAITFSGTLCRLSTAVTLDLHAFDGITLLEPAAPSPKCAACCWRLRFLLLRTYFKRPRKCLVPVFSSNDVLLVLDAGNGWKSLTVLCIDMAGFSDDLSTHAIGLLILCKLNALRLAHGRPLLPLQIGRITSMGNA